MAMVMKFFRYSLLILGFGLMLSSCVSREQFDDLARENEQLHKLLDRERNLTRQHQTYIDSTLSRLVIKAQRNSGIDVTTIPLPSSGDVMNRQQMQRYKEQMAIMQESIDDRDRRIIELEKGLVGLKPQLGKYKDQLNSTLEGLIDQGLTVDLVGEEVHVSVENRLLFPSGGVKLTKTGQSTLQQIAQSLANQRDFLLRIEGHTDNIPVSNLGKIQDNWDLSATRAIAVARNLIAQGIPPSMIMVAGRSAYAPIATNDTEKGRQKNRRINIALEPLAGDKYDGDLSDLAPRSLKPKK